MSTKAESSAELPFDLTPEQRRMVERLMRQYDENKIADAESGFHAQDGWHFKRMDDGSVRITKVCGTTIQAQVVLPAPGWASIVCSVSAGGETRERWIAQQAFHDGAEQSEDDKPGTWIQAQCYVGTGHYFNAYVRSGDPTPMYCNEHLTRTEQAQDDTQRIAEYVELFAENYPEDVFPPEGNGHGRSPDAVAALVLRRMLPIVAKDIREGRWREEH